MGVLWLTQMSFSRTAADLTDQDLFEQIEEAKTYIANDGFSKNDPSSFAWNGFRDALIINAMLLCMELCFKRGLDDKQFWLFSRTADSLRAAGEFRYEPPPWFRDKDVIRSHRSHLARNNPQAYAEQWPGTPQGMPILWPIVNPDDHALYDLKVARTDLALVASGELNVPDSMKERIVNLP